MKAKTKRAKLWSYYWHNGLLPIKWRVLNADKDNAGNSGAMFLLSENPLASDVCFDNLERCNNIWQDSDAQAWCKDFAGESGNAVENAYNDKELAAIQSTSLTDGFGEAGDARCLRKSTRTTHQGRLQTSGLSACRSSMRTNKKS